MRYASDGGKRLRGFLVLETAGLFGRAGSRRSMPPPPSNASMPTASSMTTCPAWMTTTCGAGDRRFTGKWDEATAVLVGDALQTFAFELLTDPAAGDADQRLA
jgi:farnesyl diphosphate synthase